MGVIENLITIINNSKQINELPSLPSVEAGDLIGVYSLANNRLEKFNLNQLSNKSFSYSINSISQNIGTSVINGKLDLEYSLEKVTKILFDSTFSQYLQGFNALLSQFTYTIKLFNLTQKKVHIAEIVTINNVGASNANTLVGCRGTIEVSSLSINDVLTVQISVQHKQKNTIYIEGNPFEHVPIVGNDGSSFEAGDLAINGWINQTTYGKILSYVSGDATQVGSWEIIEQI